MVRPPLEGDDPAEVVVEGSGTVATGHHSDTERVDVEVAIAVAAAAGVTCTEVALGPRL